MKDRLLRGCIAGAIGGIFANMWSFFMGWMELSTLRFVDWTAIILYGHIAPFTLGEIAFALLIQLGYCAGAGIIFSYLLLVITSRNLYFRGWLFSCATWAMVYAVTLLFKVEGTIPLPLKTVISDFIGASIYGVVLAQCVKALIPNTEKSLSGRSIINFMPEPAAKRFDKDKDDKDK